MKRLLKYRLSPLDIRRILDLVITFSIASLLMVNGAGKWSLLTIPLSIWSHYDGRTRQGLMENHQ